tara:strand:+ start:18640 stop:20766 length:2127 start_codon:yes stop_codon:yes gene_type:complete
MHGQHGLKWSHFILLAFVLVLGIIVPMAWHRKHGRNPIEPLHPRFIRVTPPSKAATPVPSHAPQWRIDLASTDRSGSAKIAASEFRRYCSIADPPPYFRSPAWPRPHAFIEKLEFLEEKEPTRDWALQVRKQINRLIQCESLTDENTIIVFDALQHALDQRESITSQLESRDAYYLNATCHDLNRRLTIWRAGQSLMNTFPQGTVVLKEPFLGVTCLQENQDSRGIAVFSIDVSELLASLEQYEFSRLSSDATKIARVIDPLLNSKNDAQRELGEVLDLYYRNANIRIVASEDLMNRFMPTSREQASRIDDHVLGIPVWGNSYTRSTLQTRLIPDPHRIRIGLEVWGRVFSDTVASSRKVYLYNEGETGFLVRKLILIDQQGVKAKPSVVNAISQSELIDVESDYDSIPLVGSWVRKAARKKHAEEHDDALSEMELRVASQAKQLFDNEFTPRLRGGIDRFYYDLWKPLDQLGLDPTAIELSTTEQRATGRIRLGHAGQITGFSARPRALSNSMLSMQVHESALNNGLDQLALAGRTFSLHDLYLHLMNKTGRSAGKVPESMPDNVIIAFAAKDPIRVQCDDGVVTLVVAVRRITKGKRYKWSNLRISADYGIETEGVNAYLTRQNSIRLEGKKLRTRDQIALRGVFSKLLSRGTQIALLPQKITDNPSLDDLVVNQQRIQDGWIGLAIGPIHPGSTMTSRPQRRTIR